MANDADETDETQGEEDRTDQVTDESSADTTEVVATKASQWAENAKVAKETHVDDKEKFGRLKDFFRGYWKRKKWTLPVTILALIIIILAVPFTSYKVLGLFLKHDVTVAVTDSITDKPVSGASVDMAGKTAETDAAGQAKLHVSVGPHKVAVSKHYYKDTSADTTVKLLGAQSTLKIRLVATGRQVPVSVINKITGKGIADAEISVLGTSTKTDKDGKATVVLPTTSPSQKANLKLSGYNAASVNIKVTDQVVSDNNFTLTPTGKLYFLSNLSGNVDVVKTNLDGTDRQTILAGTGKEDASNTALLATRDWKYLALLSKRDGNPGIYLIDTSDDQVTNIDGGSSTATFTLVGWSGDTFVYQVNRSNVQSWQSGAEALKSYDAAAGKLYSIDQTQGSGTDSGNYAQSSFGTVSILDDEIVYNTNWNGNGDYANGKNDSLTSVKPDGTGKKDIKDFPVLTTPGYFGYFSYSVYTLQYEPYGLYVKVPSADYSTNTYYEYSSGKLTQTDSVTDDVYNKSYPTYLLSPSDRLSFWSEVRDNKNTLFIGDQNGSGSKQVATLSEYKPYAWYTDNYLLVSYNGSELYIMPAAGSTSPLKVTDYYKPQLSFNGYGGGYGGL